MCARFEIINPIRFRDPTRFHITDASLWDEDRCDIRPTQIVPVIGGNRDLVGMRWGLVPYWAKDIKMGTKAINARSEGIADKPFFRGPIRRSRCLIPATAFFEWRQEGTQKVRYRFSRADEDLFCFAGLYDTWRDPAGGTLRSCTIITTTPNELVGAYHNRMPVILHRADEDVWLNPDLHDVEFIKQFLIPYPSDEMMVRAA